MRQQLSDNEVSLQGFLRRNATRTPDQTAFLWLEDDTAIKSLTWRELHCRALGLATRLRAEIPSGERALLLYSPGLDFLVAFFGCLYAQVVAVPLEAA